MEIKVNIIHSNIYAYHIDDEYNLSEPIATALKTMTCGYGDLIVHGYKDGHHFMITDIKHEDKMLSESEINDMYETAGCPECIGLRLDEVDGNKQPSLVANTLNKKALVIYHKDDNDGVFSGAIMKKYCEECLGNLNRVKVTCIGVDYNDLAVYQENDFNAYRKEYEYLILTDISLSLQLMKHCYNLWRQNFIWIDHHAPIIQASMEDDVKIGEYITGIREVSHSAIYHAWQYYIHFRDLIPYDQVKIPELIGTLSKWDSFTFISREDKENCYTLNKAITNSCKLDIENAEMMLQLMENEALNLKEYYDSGSLIVQAEDNAIEGIIRTDGDCTWKIQDDNNTYSACALFMQGATNSRMFKCLKHNGPEIGIVFKHKANSSWTVSIYDIQERVVENKIHLGQWCRNKYKGGGHAGAGGFTLTQDQFIQVLKTKTL